MATIPPLLRSGIYLAATAPGNFSGYGYQRGDQPDSLRPLIARLNRIRRENPALQRNQGLRFHRVEQDNVEHPQLIAYSKQSADGTNTVLVVVNLDPNQVQTGWLQLSPAELGIAPTSTLIAHDLLDDTRYRWNAEWNYVALDPAVLPVHIFRLKADGGVELAAVHRF